jgi:hypothetical protein
MRLASTRKSKSGIGRRSTVEQTSQTKKHVSAESIARMADRGKNVSGFFTNRGKMMQPIQRVNVDFGSVSR